MSRLVQDAYGDVCRILGGIRVPFERARDGNQRSMSTGGQTSSAPDRQIDGLQTEYHR